MDESMDGSYSMGGGATPGLAVQEEFEDEARFGKRLYAFIFPNFQQLTLPFTMMTKPLSPTSPSSFPIINCRRHLLISTVALGDSSSPTIIIQRHLM